MLMRMGITGGIGSGKSLVAEILKSKGVEIFSADEIANDLTENNEEVREKIIQAFGKGSYHGTTKTLDRSYIARIVFSNQKKLRTLNSIVHPAVIQAIEQKCREVERNASVPYIGIEAALVFESGLDKILDYTLGVVSDDEVRIERVKKRNDLTEQEIQRRINSQLPTDQLIEKADFILYNNETKDALHSNVEFFHSLFLTLTPQRK
jgi:dephospho-CoA kinase